MNRRHMLQAGLLLVGGAAVWVARSSSHHPDSNDLPRADSALRAQLVAALVGYELADDAIDRFLADLRLARDTHLIALDPVRRFLLSTDLFTRAAGDTGPIRYDAFYDPYFGPCRNPVLWGRPALGTKA